MHQTKEFVMPGIVAFNPYNYEIEASVRKIQGKPRVHGKAQLKKKKERKQETKTESYFKACVLMVTTTFGAKSLSV